MRMTSSEHPSEKGRFRCFHSYSLAACFTVVPLSTTAVKKTCTVAIAYPKQNGNSCDDVFIREKLDVTM